MISFGHYNACLGPAAAEMQGGKELRSITLNYTVSIFCMRKAMLTSLKEARLTGRGSQVTTIHRPKTTGSPWHILSLCFCAQHTAQPETRPCSQNHPALGDNVCPGSQGSPDLAADTGTSTEPPAAACSAWQNGHLHYPPIHHCLSPQLV